MRMSVLGTGLVQRFGFVAMAMLALSVASNQRADAMSPINPGAAVQSASHVSDGLLTEVRHGGGFHGGGFHGGGFRGGGFRGGGVHFGGSHFGGMHYGGLHHGGYRHGGYRVYGHRFHRHGFYGYGPSYYPYHRCHIVWTYYGPRRVCHWHRWHHWGMPFPLPF